MDIAELIKHPERLDRDTLYELRSILALYPYFQNARLLLLQNLYLLHDPAFDEELRRAAIYITDRSVIFQMIEAGHYKHRPRKAPVTPESRLQTDDSDSRTLSLIDDFLDSLPRDFNEQSSSKRKPTPADATVDYVAYLIESQQGLQDDETPQMKGQKLIDSFLEHGKDKIELKREPEYMPQASAAASADSDGNTATNDVNTETMARIYIKQGNYLHALQIIKQLSLDNPKKNAYFADQIRFLEKLIINNNKKIQ